MRKPCDQNFACLKSNYWRLQRWLFCPPLFLNISPASFAWLLNKLDSVSTGKENQSLSFTLHSAIKSHEKSSAKKNLKQQNEAQSSYRSSDQQQAQTYSSEPQPTLELWTLIGEWWPELGPGRPRPEQWLEPGPGKGTRSWPKPWPRLRQRSRSRPGPGLGPASGQIPRLGQV